MAVLIVTGTGTGVGKTVVTAALAALGRERGASVAVVKPAQTGLRDDEPGDLADVSRLSGVDDVHELIRYPDPLSPAAAARRSRMPTLALHDVVRTVTELAETRRLVLVEGAGGLLVRFDEEGWTLADLAVALGAPAVVVTSAGLGSLNTAALTLEAMAHRGVDLAGLVIGDWPQQPDLACRSNVRDLETISARPLAGALPEQSGKRPPEAFLDVARRGVSPMFGGRFDPAAFRLLSPSPTYTHHSPPSPSLPYSSHSPHLFLLPPRSPLLLPLLVSPRREHLVQALTPVPRRGPARPPAWRTQSTPLKAICRYASPHTTRHTL